MPLLPILDCVRSKGPERLGHGVIDNLLSISLGAGSGGSRYPSLRFAPVSIAPSDRVAEQMPDRRLSAHSDRHPGEARICADSQGLCEDGAKGAPRSADRRPEQTDVLRRSKDCKAYKSNTTRPLPLLCATPLAPRCTRRVSGLT